MLSNRRNKPFIAVNVGALPERLLESELFGHEKGAFTGAAERRLGRFELADTGTLFLDEIGEIPSATQVKLLRVLEEREFMRVGGVQPITVDVRVVAATNQPLRELVEEGQFRADLFYRLNVLRIYLPPLRERRDDIPQLVRRFVQDYSRQHDRPFHGISPEAMQMLVEYDWPGNIRELRNLIESMVVLSPGHEILPGDLPRQIRDGGMARLLPVHIGPIVRGPGGDERAGAGVHRPQPARAQAPGGGAAPADERRPAGVCGGRGDWGGGRGVAWGPMDWRRSDRAVPSGAVAAPRAHRPRRSSRGIRRRRRTW